MTNIRTIDLCPGEAVEVRVAASEDGPVIDAGNAAEIEVLRRQIEAMQNAHEEWIQSMEGIYRKKLRLAMELASAAEIVLRETRSLGWSPASSRDGLQQSLLAFLKACRQ